MDMVKQIATLHAETLNRLRNWGRYSTFDGPRTSDDENMEWIMRDAMKAELAMSRARETNRDFETTYMEVQWEVAVELAKILAETIDPALAGTDGVKIEEEDGGACGICLEDMEKGEEVRAIGVCGHKFHDHCIFQWVKRKQNCPLCRCALEPKKYTF
ncbi:hypothetical protein HRI_003403800 [Hibiscus trionum]|uniref:RING-type E3 ubiquitin transferase n=1 Tax=Hibiscus trionum TaxID=183268 RepID=A0A9W7ILS9_HIBTR|nr:hypothetical protein HRI_003403800 [Hibiscus trionum]